MLGEGEGGVTKRLVNQLISVAEWGPDVTEKLLCKGWGHGQCYGALFEGGGGSKSCRKWRYVTFERSLIYGF